MGLEPTTTRPRSEVSDRYNAPLLVRQRKLTTVMRTVRFFRRESNPAARSDMRSNRYLHYCLKYIVSSCPQIVNIQIVLIIYNKTVQDFNYKIKLWGQNGREIFLSRYCPYQQALKSSFLVLTKNKFSDIIKSP